MSTAFRVGSPADIVDFLEGARRVVLTTHLNADGDGTGCQIALAAALRSRGVDAWIVNPTPFPDVFRFLVSDPSWVVDAGTQEAHDICMAADRGVVVDTAEVGRIGKAKGLFAHLPLAIIDHHEIGPDPISGVVFRDSSAAAAGELVFEVVEAMGADWTPIIANALYTAIMTDTGGFRFSNSTERCFQVAGALVGKGAEPERIYETVYATFSLSRYRLLEKALATLTVDPNGRVAWMVVPREAYDALGATPEDLEGFVDVPRGLVGVEVALLFRETSNGMVKVSLRSTGTVDVNEVARAFGGGGHKKASGALVKGPLADALERVTTAVLSSVGR